jgi:hypothetical protein
VSSAHAKSNNERLPFEVLGLIFHQYSLESACPKLLKLETVLLVCKAWTLAALGHKTLWSRFAISIKNSESLRYWHQRVPLWVSRSSTTCLFDIEIILNPDHPSCRPEHFSSEEQLLLASIVSDLTGLDGEIARRWRTLRAIGVHDIYDCTCFVPLLSFPTPNLIDLDIKRIRSLDGSFPETPILKKVHIEHSGWNYPNLENVTDLTICAQGQLQFDEEAVSNAQKLVKLSAYCISTYSLKGCFPLLEYLRLEFIQDEEFLNSFSAPHLKTLSLRCGDAESYYLMSQCPGIQFQALERLELDAEQYDNDLDENYSYIDGVYLILNAATNIKELRTWDKRMVKFVLTLLENPSNFRDHHFILKYLEYTMELGQGEARPDRIAAFRSEAMLEEDPEGVGSDVNRDIEFDDER